MSTTVRWIAVVMALIGGLALGGHHVATAQDEIPGDPAPLTAIVMVWDCPYEGADLSTECETVAGVPVDVVADGVPVEGSGALTAEQPLGFTGVSVLLPAIGASVTASAPGVTVTVLTPDLAIGSCGGEQQCAFIDLVRVTSGHVPPPFTTFLVVVDVNCPVAGADVSTECTRVEGSLVHVAVDGEEIDGSPTATQVNDLNFYSADFRVPNGATLTVWAEPNGDGFAPAPGYDPLTISPEDFVIGSCGGEASCPYVYLVNVPVDDATEEPAVDDASPDLDVPTGRVTGDETGLVGGEAVTRLPSTGVGPVGDDGGLNPTSLALVLAWPLIAALVVIAAGAALRRDHAHR